MEFGRVPTSQLDQLDWRLPAEPAANGMVLGGTPAGSPRIYLGCSRWGHPGWVGRLYPPGTREKDFLARYVQHFGAVELNATHYKVYGASVVAGWAEKAAGRPFRFCPKMFKGVTHLGSLRGKETLTAEFLAGIGAFGEHLGPIFLQLSDQFSPSRYAELAAYLDQLPAGWPFFLELRHPGWFTKEGPGERLFEQLRARQIGAVLTDTAGRRDCLHMQLTVPRAFIRYVGYGMHPTDLVRTGAWVTQIASWIRQGMEEVYFFLHLGEDDRAPELAVRLADQLQAATGLAVQKPALTGLLF